jgi:streptogrisin D
VRIIGSTPRKVALLGVLAGGTLATALLAPTAGAVPARTGAAAPDRAVSELAAVNGVAGQQVAASSRAAALVQRLGARHAGSYLDAAGNAVVNVTDAAGAEAVRAAGATPRTVTRSWAWLTGTQARLAGTAGTVVAIDPSTDQVVLTLSSSVAPGTAAALTAAAAKLGSGVRLERLSAPLTPLVGGGDAILTGGARCSAGFNAQNSSGQRFLITAGHCTNIGASWTTSSGQALGTRTQTSFPGNDFGVIRYNSGVANPGNVNLYNGSTQDITGSANASVGQQVCRSGSTTQVHCGSVQQTNATVTYSDGSVVRGLLRTNVCAEPGDSGGSLFAGSTAIGITSGGSGNCRTGGTTFFQPVTEPLQAFGLAVY